MKICSCCKVDKTENSFYRDKNRKDGFYPQCKDCRKKYFSKYYKNNREKIIKNSKEYNMLNYEDKINYGKKWRNENKNKLRESIRNWELKNKEKIKEKKKIWSKNNKQKILLNSSNQRHKRRALYKNTDITTKWLISLKENSRYCPICNSEMMEENNHRYQYNLDHIIPLNQGGKHSKNNVRYICRYCNQHRKRKMKELYVD